MLPKQKKNKQDKANQFYTSIKKRWQKNGKMFESKE